MGSDLIRPEKRSTDRFHPGIYAAVVGLVVLFVISAFAFGDHGYADYLLAVVVGFFVMAMGVPYLLWLTWRNQTRADRDNTESLRDWSRGDYEIWQCRLKGREAAIQVLLPIAAVAVGMTVIGIVLLLVEYHVV